MKRPTRAGLAVVLFFGLAFMLVSPGWAKVKVWEGTIVIPTYTWEEDVNPKFWAMEGSAKLSTTVKGSITYPYTMQDHLSRTKVDRTYKAVFLENEYLKITCLPELGGRLHSVLDKTKGQEMFHLNRVIKPSMIAMRGAFISGGVEWNTGPHGHTVTILSPVDVFHGENPDGSAFLEINNIEKIFRTRWTVRVTLHPGRAYLDERIRISNPTDGMHPYYFWNCTAFPNRPGTRFIYPMTLGTDHNGTEFFTWPVHKGKDLTWLKNYEIYTSVFAYRCEHDFFGAYDVDADRGIVSVANHRELPGKKAWTWGEWEFGKVAQKNLTDDDGPYIEVQSGPLPTQSDYGLLGPHEEVSWQEWWYPAHGLGDGFEFATKDVAVQTARKDGRLELRLLATAKYPGATCVFSRGEQELLRKKIDLTPDAPQVVKLDGAGTSPVEVRVLGEKEAELARFTTPLPIRKVSPPDPARFKEKPEDQMTVEDLYLKGRKLDRDTNRLQARDYYEKAVARDPGFVPALRGLAVLDVESGLYQDAVRRLEKALQRDPDDGLCWYYLGVSRLRLGRFKEALECGHRAARCFGTVSLGYDLAGRAAMRMKDFPRALDLFAKAVRANAKDDRAHDHWMVALLAAGDKELARREARRRIAERPSDLVPRAILDCVEMNYRCFEDARPFLGEEEFETLETALFFADLGSQRAWHLLASRYLKEKGRPLPLYYMAYFVEDRDESLKTAAAIDGDFVFPSRPEEVDILKHATERNPGDANAHLHLGNLYANLGRLDEAAQHWEKSAALAPAKSMALRNLGLVAWAKGDLPKAEGLYRKAVAGRPQDQTLYRDLAEILLAAAKRPEAIRLLETMPVQGMRRAEITITLTQAYLDEKRFGDAVKLLESTPYFVNWEGQDVTWKLFNKAHVERGRHRFDAKEYPAALADFEAALTYPANLNVGRSNRPEEATAQYWRGKALEALGRLPEARAAWKEGAAGCEGSDAQNQHRQLCREALEKTK
jgi:tetratricopeptide (TPR) repeat protein